MKQGQANRTLIILLAVLALAAAFRLIDLDRHGLWVDEGFTARLTELPASRYHGELLSDTAPPLYYYLTRPLAIVAPRNVFVLRLLPAVCGIISVLLIYLLAVELFGSRWSGLLAATLLAASRHHVVHCQEARNYSLYFMLSLLAMTCVARLARRPMVDGWGRRALLWALFVIGGAGMVYTHNIGWFCLAGLLLFYPIACLVRGDRRGGVLGYVPLIDSILAGLFILLLFLPWMSVFIFQSQHVMHDYWIARPTLERFVNDMIRLISLPPNVPDDVHLGVVPHAMTVLTSISVWLLGLLGWAYWLFRGKDMRAVALATCMAASMLAVVGISMIAQPVFMEKVVIFAMVIPVLGVASFGAVRLTAGVRRVAIATLIWLAALTMATAVANHGLQYGDQWREATRYAVQQADPAREPLLVDATFHLMSVAWYVHDTPYGPVDWSRGDCGTLLHQNDPAASQPDAGGVLPRLRQAISQPGGRVWLVQRGHEDRDINAEVLPFLESLGPVVEKKEFLGVSVRAYRVDRIPRQ